MDDIKRNKNPRNVIVVLDDRSEWLEMHTKMLNRMPESESFEIVRFSDNKSASNFVRDNASRIQGYVQDLNRRDWEVVTPTDGISFLEDVVATKTPSAKTVVVSGTARIADIEQIYKSTTYYAEFIPKDKYDYAGFRRAYLRLIEPQDTDFNDRKQQPNTELQNTFDLLQPPWNEVCDYITRHPNFLHTMNPRLFEELVAEIFRKHGWIVELSAKTRDCGFDIIAIRRNSPSDLRVLAEAKRFSPDRPVGVDIVRALYGIRTIQHAAQVVLATSSYVSGPNTGHPIFLLSREKLNN